MQISNNAKSISARGGFKNLSLRTIKNTLFLAQAAIESIKGPNDTCKLNMETRFYDLASFDKDTPGCNPQKLRVSSSGNLVQSMDFQGKVGDKFRMSRMHGNNCTLAAGKYAAAITVWPTADFRFDLVAKVKCRLTVLATFTKDHALLRPVRSKWPDLRDAGMACFKTDNKSRIALLLFNDNPEPFGYDEIASRFSASVMFVKL